MTLNNSTLSLKRLALLTAIVLSAPAQTPSTKEARLKIPEIFDALAISSGSVVADVGAGEGFYTERLAKRVGPGGQVYAVDIDEENALPTLKQLVKAQSLSNVAVIRSEPADPKLPAAGVDAVLMVITYHEIASYEEMLRHILIALKPGGRLVVVDFMPRKTRPRPRAEQTKNHQIAPELAEPEFRAAGFDIVSRQDDFVNWPDEEETRWMIVCRKPSN